MSADESEVEGKPASEAGFLVCADRVRVRREEFASEKVQSKKTIIAGSGDFMGRDLWEREGRAA